MDLAGILRESELKSIRVQLANGLRENVLKSLDERGGAQELVRQQYSGRYPFELLQNANDAALETGTQGRARFLLTDTAVIVADNGSGFGEKQIEAICSLGRSSKGPGTAIGHKGLGFKSVGEITDRPQVISRQASFQFDGDRVRKEAINLLGYLPNQQKFPVYAFPFPVEDHDLDLDAAEVRDLYDADFTTIIRLPLRAGVTRETVSEHLVECLLPRLLLFLRGIDHLELRGTHADFSVEVSRGDEQGAEHVLLEVDGRDEEWLIYRDEVVPDLEVLEPMGEAWTKINVVHVAVAVPIDVSGEPRTDESFPLHVYFPTEESPGLHVAVHADWALSMDRCHLAATPEALPYNRMLLHRATDFVANRVAVDLVRRRNASVQAVQALVPSINAPTQGVGMEFRRLWSNTLSTVPFLPTVDGSLQVAASIRLLPGKLPSLTDAHSMATLESHRTLRPNVEDSNVIRAFIASVCSDSEMGLGEYLGQLRLPTKESASVYYTFLTRWRKGAADALMPELRRLSCLLTTNGEVLTPEKDTVFLPRVRGDSSVPDDIPVPIAEMPDVNGIDILFRDLGVRPFEWRELIREFLIKILANPNSDVVERSRAMAGLRAYHGMRLSGSEELESVLTRVLLPARSSDGSVRRLRAAGELYFASAWTGLDELEVIFGPFGDAEFLDVSPPGGSDEIEDDLSFYRMLGVVDHPRLSVAKATERNFMIDSGRHPHRDQMFGQWMNQPGVARASRCPQGHPASQQLKVSTRLYRHSEIVQSGEPIRLIALWNQLARHWGSVYEPAMEAVFHCLHGSHSGDRDRRCQSLFAYTLRSQPWVPVARGAVADVVRPEEAWIDSYETPRHVKERIPRISEAMYKTRGGAAMAHILGLTDAGRPKIRDLLVLLESIAQESDAVGGTNRDMELAARYVQRTLNDVLGNDPEPHPNPDSVRLLASSGGSTAFVPRPPFADDPLLRDTWERHRHILAAEVGLGRFTRYFSLTKLDDSVVTSAMPYGQYPQDSVYAAVHKKIAAIKPYILALVRTENSRAENSVRPALRQLELILCDRLVLSYKFEGVIVDREDAVCYIAVRQVTQGRTRNIGTAYLELDAATGEPHWFPLGRQLAQYLGVPGLSDGITMLLTASEADRQRMMADRQIHARDIDEARQQLQLPVEDYEQVNNVLDSLMPTLENRGQPLSAPVNTNALTAAELHGEGITSDDFDGSQHVVISQHLKSTRVPPPVDYGSVRISDSASGLSGPIGSTSARRGGLRTPGASSAPSIGDYEENHRIGKRGEEIAYNVERRRLRDLGKNPDLAIWVSQTHELSPYDIKSIDADDQLIFIEVKSTRSSDPGEPFYISHGELIEAIFYRERFFIYRVTDVDTATPAVIRAADPLRLVKEGRGRLLLAKAHMALAFEKEFAKESTPT